MATATKVKPAPISSTENGPREYETLEEQRFRAYKQIATGDLESALKHSKLLAEVPQPEIDRQVEHIREAKRQQSIAGRQSDRDELAISLRTAKNKNEKTLSALRQQIAQLQAEIRSIEESEQAIASKLEPMLKAEQWLLDNPPKFIVQQAEAMKRLAAPMLAEQRQIDWRIRNLETLLSLQADGTIYDYVGGARVNAFLIAYCKEKNLGKPYREVLQDPNYRMHCQEQIDASVLQAAKTLAQGELKELRSRWAELEREPEKVLNQADWLRCFWLREMGDE